MTEIMILRKIVKTLILKKGLPLDPKTITRDLPNEAKQLGVHFDELVAALRPIIDEILEEARMAYKGERIDLRE